jgi:hypothetical protein
MTNEKNYPNEKSFDLRNLDDIGLLQLRAEIDSEARSRGLRFNVGEIGEKLAIAEFKGRADLPVLLPTLTGTKNIDAISRNGERYSIKTMQRAKKSGTIYPDREDEKKQLFEYILIVLMRDDFTLERIIQLDWDLFCNVRSWDVRMSAWYIARSERALARGCQIYPR